TYRNHFKSLIPFGIVIAILSNAMQLVMTWAFFGGGLGDGGDPEAGRIFFGLLVVFALMVIMLVGYATMIGACIEATRATWRNERPRAGELWERLKVRLGRIILTLLLSFLILMGIGVVLTIVFVVLVIIPILGWLMLIPAIPAMFAVYATVSAALSIAPSAAVEEDRSASDAVSRGWSLMFPKGRPLWSARATWWRGALFFLVAMIVGYVLNILAAMPAMVPQWIAMARNATPVYGPLGPQFLPLTFQLPLTLLTAILQGLVMPFGLVAWPILYYDLRARLEGLDLDRRLADLETDEA
ncbi:MAG: hypothetical protein OER88_01480, partial [Planctomycetota bacterium]|nr:hypothetical protein [Planctomycetota bacterium]